MGHSKIKPGISVPKNRAGFTLIELMIGLAISTVVSVAMITVFINLQRNSLQQVEVAMMQQNLRGVLNLIERDLRNIGRDWNQAKIFGVTDIRDFHITEPGTSAYPDNSADGHPILQFTLDINDNAQIDGNETVTYLLYDRDNDPSNGFDFGRTTAVDARVNLINGRQLLAEGVEDIGFAYAFDADGDDKIDRVIIDPLEAPSIIWAVDTNNDGELDQTMEGDDLGGIETSAKNLLPASVVAGRIRAVQVWILGRTDRRDPRSFDRNVYTLANRVVDPDDDNSNDRRRWLLSEVIHLRNF